MCNTITSVLGFDLDAEITDNEGNVLASGTTCNYIPEEKPDYMFIIIIILNGQTLMKVC